MSDETLPELQGEENIPLPVGSGVERYLERIYTEAMKDRDWYSPDTIHVTDLVSDCERSVVLGKLFPRGFNINSLLYVEDGRSKHSIVLGDEEHHEFRVEYAGIRGSIDDYEEASGTIYEKKTTMRLPKAPRPEHERQIKYYAAMLKELGYEVRTGIIIYILRTMDDLPIEFQYDLTSLDAKAILSDMVKRADRIREMVRDRTLPPRRITWFCRFCNYSDLCLKYGSVVPKEDVT